MRNRLTDCQRRLSLSAAALAAAITAIFSFTVLLHANTLTAYDIVATKVSDVAASIPLVASAGPTPEDNAEESNTENSETEGTEDILQETDMPDRMISREWIPEPEEETLPIAPYEDLSDVPYGVIPATYGGLRVGYIWDVAYGDRDDWNEGSPQGKINSLWREKGCCTSDGVMTLDGLYMIACKEIFGEIGDSITFAFDDGFSIDCLIYDHKGCEYNATPLGHINDAWTDVKVLELYMPDAGDVSFMSRERRVCSYDNHGRYLDDWYCSWD